MTNHDRLLQFLYDCHKVRCEYLTDLADHQMRFYMTEFDGQRLVYTANGGSTATLFVFTLRGKFKYNAVVNINGAAIGKKPVQRTKVEAHWGTTPRGNEHVLDTGLSNVGAAGTGN